MKNQIKSSWLEVILFKFTRVSAIISLLISIVAITFIVFNLIEFKGITHVSLKDINTKSSTQGRGSSVSEALSRSLIIPHNVKKYLGSGNNNKILQGWLDMISNQKQKQDFLNNMSSIITDAKKKKVDVITVINNYKTIKLSKLNSGEIIEMGQKAVLYSTIFGLIIFATLVILILVMLAIERNTRYEMTTEQKNK